MLRYTLIFCIFLSCTPMPSPEDLTLMEKITREELQRTNRFVVSMQARLEFYGAPAEEARYLRSSETLLSTRNSLLDRHDMKAILAYNDTLNSRIEAIGSSEKYIGSVEWSASEEQLQNHYRKLLEDEFDSLNYYKYLYTILKKEYAIHVSNAQMMDH